MTTQRSPSLLAVALDWSPSIGRSRLVALDWSLSIGRPRLVALDWSPSIGRPRLVALDWSLSIGRSPICSAFPRDCSPTRRTLLTTWVSVCYDEIGRAH